jgi:tetratricopeptide (TPR) repeat protein
VRPCSAAILSLVSCAVLTLALIHPLPAQAQGLTIEQQAVQHFENSKKLYSQGRLRESLEELRTAHRLVPDRDLLLNIAKIEDKLHLKREALASYREYLAQNPESAERPKIEHRMTLLKAELDEADRRAAAPPVVRPPVTVQPAVESQPTGFRRVGIWPVLVFATGAGVLIGGLVLNHQAIAQANKAMNPAADPDGDLYRVAQRDYNTSIGLIVGGAVVAAGGFTWGIINLVRTRPASSASTTPVTVSGGLLPGGGSLMLRGRF